jgi:hypothetical protein
MDAVFDGHEHCFPSPTSTGIIPFTGLPGPGCRTAGQAACFVGENPLLALAIALVRAAAHSNTSSTNILGIRCVADDGSTLSVGTRFDGTALIGLTTSRRSFTAFVPGQAAIGVAAIFDLGNRAPGAGWRCSAAAQGNAIGITIGVIGIADPIGIGIGTHLGIVTELT